MVLFNTSTKELTAKVVYYGPGLCGKTTNLQWIHEKLPVKNKGKMLSLATETDRTLFFDFLPIDIGAIRGMKTRIQLYTVPGQVFYDATRRMVLKGADAIVFVCDSQEAMLEANLESLENLAHNLEANEIAADDLPMVLQYNKRDLPNALPLEILNERLNPRGYPFHEAVAVKGVGVEETLKTVTKLVFKSLSTRYGDAGATTARPSAAPPSPALAISPDASLPPISLSPDASLPPVSISAEASLRSVATSPDGSLPPLELELTPAPAERPVAAAVRAATVPPRAAARKEIPTRPPLSPEPPPPPRPEDPPANRTIIARRDEADDLRRRIASPGIVENSETELELEEIELDPQASGAGAIAPMASAARPPAASLPPLSRSAAPLPPASRSVPPVARSAPPVPPRPAPQPDPPGVAEVSVPIEIEVAPGATQVSLNIRLLLTLKRR